MRRLRSSIYVSFLCFVSAGTVACGYSLKRSDSPLLEAERLKTIYLDPTINDTFKTGVEVTIYNALQKELLRVGQIALTRDREAADAVLSTVVTSAAYEVRSTTPSVQLQPTGLGRSDRDVVTVYYATLGCSFTLRKNPKPKKGMTLKPVVTGKTPVLGKTLWAQDFARGKSFAANSQLGALGTTSALINESEFERALGDLAEQILSDFSESLLAAF